MISIFRNVENDCFLVFDYLMPILLIITMALWQHAHFGRPVAENLLHHWPSKAGMMPQSHCGDKEDECGDKDGHIRLSSRLHYVLRSLLCAS